MGGNLSNSGYVESSGSGTITALNVAVTIPCPATSTAMLVVSGTWVATLSFEASVDGTTYFSVQAQSVPGNAGVTSTVANGQFGLSVGGYQSIRVRASAYTSGTATVTYNTDSNTNNSISPDVINGGTDGTPIGNTSDRLRVDSQFATPPRVIPSNAGTKLRVVDMNVASGGVARGTGINSTSVYTTVFNYTGSGHIFSLLVGFEGNLIGADDFNIKFEIDSQIVFEITTSDIGTGNLYNLNATGDEATMGMSLTSNVFRFTAVPTISGIFYATSAKVSIKKATSATSKQFRAGMVYMTKET